MASGLKPFLPKTVCKSANCCPVNTVVAPNLLASEVNIANSSTVAPVTACTLVIDCSKSTKVSIAALPIATIGAVKPKVNKEPTRAALLANVATVLFALPIDFSSPFILAATIIDIVLKPPISLVF